MSLLAVGLCSCSPTPPGSPSSQTKADRLDADPAVERTPVEVMVTIDGVQRPLGDVVDQHRMVLVAVPGQAISRRAVQATALESSVHPRPSLILFTGRPGLEDVSAKLLAGRQSGFIREVPASWASTIRALPALVEFESPDRLRILASGGDLLAPSS